jgi:hypothetical protein
MKQRVQTLLIVAAALLAGGAAQAQVYSVPMKGLGNEWVKGLTLKGTMDWEWIETYPDQVFFATRQDAKRDGDIVTMWMRIEYQQPRSPGPHSSALSRDQWDCKQKRRANVGTFFFRWNNLEDGDPEHSTALMASWEPVEPGTLAQTLLDFACSITPTQQLVDPNTPATGKP